MENFEKIEQRREFENKKDELRQMQRDLDVLPEVKILIPEPIPNDNHSYCLVCNETYDDYLKHINESETHKKRAKIQDMPFKEIDMICDELNKKQKWKNHWKSDPVGSDKQAIEEFKSIQQGRHWLCQQLTQQNE